LKQERRAAEPAAGDDSEGSSTGTVRRAQDEVLAELARVHQQFDDEAITFDEFEAAKSELLAELAV
jgi:hypothetical protein